jgi:hypothetical protein
MIIVRLTLFAMVSTAAEAETNIEVLSFCKRNKYCDENKEYF